MIKENQGQFINSTHKIFFVLVILYSILSCSNIFKPAANLYTDKALYYEARRQIDDRNYLQAITNLNLLSADFAANNDVRVTFAAAYAGACGMEFITFFGNLKNANIGGSVTFFKFLMSSFADRETTPSYCTQAERKIKDIGMTVTERLAATGKSDSSMFMAILAMAKIGSYIRTKADIDGANGLGDGIVDVTFDPCLNQASGGFESTEIDEIATGFALLLENLPSLLAAGASSSLQNANDGLNTAKGFIDQICSLPPYSVASGNCVPTDISLVASSDLKNFRFIYRNLLAFTTVGIGSAGAINGACSNLPPD